MTRVNTDYNGQRRIRRARSACRELAGRARSLFVEARRTLAACERRRVRPAAVMLEVYERLLMRLEARGWDRLDEPVRVPAREKLWIALRHLVG